MIKKVLLVGLVFFSGFWVNAQLDCSSNVEQVFCGQTFVGASANGLPNNVTTYACTTWTDIGPERVHTFVPVQSGSYMVEIDGYTGDLDVFVLTDCDANTCVGDLYSDSVVWNGFVAGSTYYIVVDSDDGSASGYELNVHYLDGGGSCPVVTQDSCDVQLGLVAVDEVSSNGASDGSVELQIINQPTNFSIGCYDFSDAFIGSPVLDGATQNFILDSLAVGSYYARVLNLDDTSCFDTLHFSVVLDSADTSMTCMMSVDVFTTEETATNASDASAWLEVIGAVGNVNILWSTGQFSDSISGLSAGNYSVVVTDSLNCVETKFFQISTLQDTSCNLTLQVFKTDETAQGAADGSATATASGAQGAVAYFWSTGETTGVINNLAPSTYALTITDSAGCTASSTVTILAYSDSSSQGADSCDFTIAVNTANETMSGASDGSATVQVNGPNGTYTYQWNTGQSGPALYNLEQGVYLVTVSDQNNCTQIGFSSVGVDDPVFVHQKMKHQLRGYPNPVNDQLFIDLAEHQISIIKVFDQTGKMVLIKSTGLDKNLISLSVGQLSKGIYSVKLLAEDAQVFCLNFIKLD